MMPGSLRLLHTASTSAINLTGSPALRSLEGLLIWLEVWSVIQDMPGDGSSMSDVMVR